VHKVVTRRPCGTVSLRLCRRATRRSCAAVSSRNDITAQNCLIEGDRVVDISYVKISSTQPLVFNVSTSMISKTIFFLTGFTARPWRLGFFDYYAIKTRLEFPGFRQPMGNPMGIFVDFDLMVSHMVTIVVVIFSYAMEFSWPNGLQLERPPVVSCLVGS